MAPRAAIAARDARTLARELLSKDLHAHRGAVRGSPMTRDTPPAMRRNAAVGLGAVGTADGAPMLERALDDHDPRVHDARQPGDVPAATRHLLRTPAEARRARARPPSSPRGACA